MNTKNNRIALILSAAIAAAVPAVADTTSTNSTTATSTNTTCTSTNTIAGGLTEIYEAIESSGLTTATNYAIEPYLTYAGDAPSGNKVGGGAFLAYNLSKYVAPGLEVDYLGQFSLVSATVTLRAPTYPLAFTGWSWATNMAFVPVAIAGVGKSLSGGGSGAIAVTDAGAYVEFGHLWGGRFDVGGTYGRWDNAGAYSGPREHLFIGWSKGF